MERNKKGSQLISVKTNAQCKSHSYQMEINHWNFGAFSVYNEKPWNIKFLMTNLKGSAN